MDVDPCSSAAGNPEWSEPAHSFAPPRPQPALAGAPFAQTALPGGKPWLAIYRQAPGYLVRLPGVADFVIDSAGCRIAIHPVPGITHQTIDHYYQNQAVPLALSLQKKLVLHGSAVVLEGAAIAFVGDSGCGKSTLAASFSSSGWPFLTDDSLVIEQDSAGYLVRPSHPSLRLWEDSIQALTADRHASGPATRPPPKARILADQRFRFCAQSRPLRHLYFLGDGSAHDVSIDSLYPRDRVIQLVRHCFLLSADEPASLAWNLRQLAAFVERVRIYRLDYPRRYEALARIHRRVREHLSAESGLARCAL